MEKKRGKLPETTLCGVVRVRGYNASFESMRKAARRHHTLLHPPPERFKWSFSWTILFRSQVKAPNSLVASIAVLYFIDHARPRPVASCHSAPKGKERSRLQLGSFWVERGCLRRSTWRDCGSCGSGRTRNDHTSVVCADVSPHPWSRPNSVLEVRRCDAGG